MQRKVVRCESYGCKNLTNAIHKEVYGSYCFEHTSKVKAPIGFQNTTKILSPVSPRNFVIPLVSNHSKLKPSSPIRSPLMESKFENYTSSKMIQSKVSPVKIRTPSPKRSKLPELNSDEGIVSFLPKIECGICLKPYDQNKIMKCGHFICPECLEGIVRSPYCYFCDELMEGPFITPEVIQILEDRYKEDLQKGEEISFDEELEPEEEDEYIENIIEEDSEMDIAMRDRDNS